MYQGHLTAQDVGDSKVAKSLAIEDLQYLNITQDTTWNAARARELARLLTREESKRILEGQSRETLAKERFWQMRPDDIAVLPLVENKAGIFYILEYKRTSDFTDQYLLRAQSTAENRYTSLRSALSEVTQRQG